MKENEKFPFVSVIFPSYNRREILVNSVKDVLKQDYPNFEIVIIDQTDDQDKEILDFFGSHKDKIKYVHISEKGASNARNVGSLNASGEILLFFDDDIEIPGKDIITDHVKALQRYKDKNVGLIGGRVVANYDWNPHFKYVGRIKYFGLKQYDNYESVDETEMDRIPGGNFSCYKALYDKVGGFDPIFIGKAFYEEVDFSLKIKRLGYRVFFAPSALIKHLAYKVGGNRALDVYEFRYWWVHNTIIFYLRNYPHILFPIIYTKMFFWAVFSAAKRLDYKMFKKMYGGLIDGWRYYNKNNKPMKPLNSKEIKWQGN